MTRSLPDKEGVERMSETKADTTVRCRMCGTAECVSFSIALRQGWPMCCGETMGLVTQPSKETIDFAVSDLFAPVRAKASGPAVPAQEEE